MLGTSNSLVWGIDECLNTHHFCSFYTTKTFENTQESPKIPKIILDCVFMPKGLKTDEKKQTLHNLQFQSSNFHKLAKLVPGKSKLVKISF